MFTQIWDRLVTAPKSRLKVEVFETLAKTAYTVQNKSKSKSKNKMVKNATCSPSHLGQIPMNICVR